MIKHFTGEQESLFGEAKEAFCIEKAAASS